MRNVKAKTSRHNNTAILVQSYIMLWLLALNVLYMYFIIITLLLCKMQDKRRGWVASVAYMGCCDCIINADFTQRMPRYFSVGVVR